MSQNSLNLPTYIYIHIYISPTARLSHIEQTDTNAHTNAALTACVMQHRFALPVFAPDLF